MCFVPVSAIQAGRLNEALYGYRRKEENGLEAYCLPKKRIIVLCWIRPTLVKKDSGEPVETRVYDVEKPKEGGEKGSVSQCQTNEPAAAFRSFHQTSATLFLVSQAVAQPD